MPTSAPSVVVLAGPNGAGKTTSASWLLKGSLGVSEFVNADVIAQGLSAFAPDAAALAATEVMVQRIRKLAAQRVDFAFETTLAGRSLAPWLRGLIADNYRFRLVFLWLPSSEMAAQRVAGRVRMGGHDVPEETIRRRYDRGLRNFFRLYQPLATTWRFYDNSRGQRPKLVACGCGSRTTRIVYQQLWNAVQEGLEP
jgi:predicted ABC-type ATPase